MKIRSAVTVACCAALLIATGPLIALDPGKTLVLTAAEPQYASKLCWAAADVLAVNQFYPVCPTSLSPTATSGLFPTSQALEAGYQAWFYSAKHPDPGTFGGFLSDCEGTSTDNIQGLICNVWGNPVLHGLTFKWGKDFVGTNGLHDPDGLDWATMTQEIDAGRPVLFVWNYASNGTDQDSPVGNHELVVIGYSVDDTGTQQLQIWDPWTFPEPPPVNVPACGPASGVQATQEHNRQIPFSSYRIPIDDMGVPVTAVHDQDQWGLALAVAPEAPVLTIDGGPPPLPTPPPWIKPPQPSSGARQQLSFARALSMATPESRKLDLRVSGAAARSLGVPFPIVGLGFVQLLGAANDPTRLLAGTTSAILFPVESQGKIVDAFLMLFMDGRWQRGGYANVEITRRLVDVRATQAARRHLPLESFYMVSVPGEVAFFAAYGKGKNAILIPVSTDRSIGAVAGVAMPAEKQLTDLIHGIRVDLQRDRDRRGGKVVRPVG